MFYTPLKHTRIEGMKGLEQFSYKTGFLSTHHKNAYAKNNGQIAYACRYGIVFVTPYRSETIEILTKAGYTEAIDFYVPFSMGEDRPDAYKKLVRMAKEENWAETYEKAYEYSLEKGIKPVRIQLFPMCQLKEIKGVVDTGENIICSAMTKMFLKDNSKENIGTFIIIDDAMFLICDEYGRTFLLKTNATVDDIVSCLIEAGYTKTANPQKYVKFVKT